MLFLAAAGALVSALSSANAADAQRRYANAVKKASVEDMPPAWQAKLGAIEAQSQADEAKFNQTVADQEKIVKAVLYGGGALLVIYLVLKL